MADGLFGDGQFGEFMMNPMAQLGIALLAAPRRDAQGRGTGLGQQLGSAMNTSMGWQQALGQMRAQQMQQQQMQAQQQKAQREAALRERMTKGEFNTPEGQLDYEKLFQQGIMEGVMPFESGMKLQETKENREERLAQNKALAEQRAELLREQMAQRGEIAQAQIDMRRDLAGMTSAIARQNADTQRMMVQARIDDMKQRQAISPFSQAPSYKSGLRVLEQQTKELPALDQVENDIKRWQQLNDTVDTGPVAGRLPTQYFNSEFQELKALENKLAMNNFKPGQGQMSNFERSLIVGGGPNTKNYREANRNITQIMLGATQNAREKLDFQQAWLDAKGTVAGADAAWQKYLDANPRFTLDAKTKTLMPNQKRQDWGSFFAGTAAAPQAPAQAAPAQPQGQGRTVVRRGREKSTGRTVIQYSDGTIEYGN